MSVRPVRRVRGCARTLPGIKTRSIHALLAALLLASGGNAAQAAAPSWAAECAARDDDTARLACYDSHNPPRKTATPAAQSPGAAPAAAGNVRAAPHAAARENFGLPEPPKPAAVKAAEDRDLLAHVTSVSEKVTGELLLKLDNGQSWVQAQRNTGVRIRTGERVSIARGVFGGYLLRSDSGASMRVRRLE